MQRLVLDTNSLLQALPRRSSYHDLWSSFFDGRNRLCVSNEILSEYEELLHKQTTKDIAKIIIDRILDNPYTLLITPFFKFNLIKEDPDDNKFVDCAICAGAKFIVTEDKHFQILKKIDFPKVDIISLDEAMKII